MNLRPLFIVLLGLLFVGAVCGQVPLEKPDPSPAPITTVPPSTPPPAAPPASNPLGLLLLAVVLAHVCLPLSLLLVLLVLLVCFKLFRGGLTKFFMGLAAAGGARGIKGILTSLGVLIVIPAGFMGLNWAVRWLDYPVPGATRLIYGLVVSVATGWVFFTVMKVVVRGVKQKFMGRMGGGLMGQFGGGPGMKQVRGKARRR